MVQTASVVRALSVVIALSSVPVAESQTPTPYLHPTQELRLDADREDFSVIGRVLVGRSGTMVIQQPQDSWLLFYDSTGKRIAKLGRAGGGPGEFRRFSASMGWLADTAWVFDSELRRLTLVAPNGRLVRTIALPPRLLAPRSRSCDSALRLFTPLGLAPDGSILGEAVHDTGRCDQRAAPITQTTTAVVAARNGEIRSTLTVVPFSPFNAMAGTPALAVSTNIPFLIRPVRAASPDGRAFAWSSPVDSTVDSVDVRITIVRTTGDTALSVIHRFRRLMIAKSLLDSALAVNRQGFSGGRYPPALVDELIANMRAGLPNAHPAILSIVVGLDGTTWLEMPDVDGASLWLMLDAAGAKRGIVPLRPHQRLIAATSSRIWTVERDADGLQRVVRYGIAPRR